jgi:hypothetical protein
MWIFHAFSGMDGSHNDNNMLQFSTVFAKFVEGHASPTNYMINGHEHNNDTS